MSALSAKALAAISKRQSYNAIYSSFVLQYGGISHGGKIPNDRMLVV